MRARAPLLVLVLVLLLPACGGDGVDLSEAKAEDVSNPTTVVGDGTPASCTSAAVVAAVAAGGVVTFDCGPDPVTITLAETARVFNDKGPRVVIDGGGLVTLSGGGARRILYMNTCDPDLVWTTDHCQNQDTPQLTVQNLAFVDADSRSETEYDGGGAIWVRGGRFKIVNCTFKRNLCAESGPDVGGGAVRVFSQYDNRPVFVVDSDFGGSAADGNVGASGGALSSIGVSWVVLRSSFSYNRAVGTGASSGNGGNGGAIYNDGNDFTLRVIDSTIEHNSANEGGGAIFFVSNDLSGDLYISGSTLRDNPSAGFETDGYPGIFVLADEIEVSDSTIE
jgi:hypothetical protein